MSESVCSSCGKPKNTLAEVPSKLWEGRMLYLCAGCLENGYEPRWLILLVLNSGGYEQVKDYIEQHKYVGKEILAREFI